MQFHHLAAAMVAAILAFTSNAAPVTSNKSIPFDENYSSTLGTFVALAANAASTNTPLLPTTTSFVTLVTREESLDTAQSTITITSKETSASMVNLDAWLSEEDRSHGQFFASSPATTTTAPPHFPSFPTRFGHGPVVPGNGFYHTDTIVGAASTPTSAEVAPAFEKQIQATYLDFLASNPEFVIPIPPFLPPLVTVPFTTPTPIVN